LLVALPVTAATPATPTIESPRPAYQVLPWKAGAKVPALQGTDLYGKVWRLQDLRGRAVLINFWASWCEPCRAEMPSLQELARTHSDRLVVLAVNFKESEPTITRFVQRTGLDLPVLRDADGAMARAWGVSVYPSTVLIDAQGRANSVVRGEVDWASQDAQRLVMPLFP
jgi:thiol-disulfide isomerase/thioredoxin